MNGSPIETKRRPGFCLPERHATGCPQCLPQSGLLTNGGGVRFRGGIGLEIQNFPQELYYAESLPSISKTPVWPRNRQATLGDIHSISGCRRTRLICIPPHHNFKELLFAQAGPALGLGP